MKDGKIEMMSPGGHSGTDKQLGICEQPKEIFEAAVIKYGIDNACEYFNHKRGGGFHHNLVSKLRDKYGW